MKKILNSLIFLSLLLVLNVKADMGPPSLPTLQARVTNANGATCEDGMKINYDEVVAVYGEEGLDYYYVDYNNSECVIKRKDVVIITDSYDLSNATKYENIYDVLVIKKDGVTMYEGPDKGFKTLGTIPYDTMLKPTYYTGTYWKYVEYNGIKGWISGEDNAVVHSPKYDGDIVYNFSINDLKITATGIWNDSNDKVIGTFPANTEVTNYWKIDYGHKYYVRYNGISGFVDNDETFAYKCDGTKIKVTKKVDVYDVVEAYALKKQTAVGSIEPNKDYDVKYCIPGRGFYAYYLTDKNAWVQEKEAENGNNSDLFVIETDSKGEVYDHTKANDPSQDNPKNPSDVEPPKEEPVPEKEQAPKPEPKNDKKLSNEELIMICVGAGVLIAVTILVIIKLVNKKKNNESELVQNSNEVEPVQNNNEESNKE